MRNTWRFVAVGTLTLAAVGGVLARGTSWTQLSPPLPDSAYEVVDTDFLIKPLGWRNVTVTGGTLGTDVITASEPFSDLLVRSNSAATPVTATGEVGFQIEWHGSVPPPASVQIDIDQSLGIEGTTGEVQADTVNKGVSVDLAQLPELAGSGMPLRNTRETIALSLSPDGLYRGEVWVSSGTVSVTGPSTGDRTKGVLSFFANRITEDAEEEIDPVVVEKVR